MKKLKRYVSLLICLTVFSIGYAETVSQKEALKMARTFFNKVNGKTMGDPKLVFNGRKLTTGRLFTPYYVYNLPTGGFVIISAENKAFPILGYSLKENFNPNEINPSLEAMLQGYAREIENIRYDSRIPDEAINAWIDYEGYLDKILGDVYNATDRDISDEDVNGIIDNILEDTSSDTLFSFSYTPEQWSDFMKEKVNKDGNVVMGIAGRSDWYPGVVHGYKNDYFRISFSESQFNDWLMRMSATEYVENMKLAALDIQPKEEELEEEEPFSLYEDFISTTTKEQQQRFDNFDFRISFDTPKLRNVGGGRYEVQAAENFALGKIYNMSGSQLRQMKYHSPVASINLEGYPYGFYIVVLQTENGNTYSYKLAR